MTGIQALTLEVDDVAAAEAFYKEAFDLGDVVRVRESRQASSGFRGLTVSLVVSQPGNVDALVRSALEAGAKELKPARKSFWGYAGVVQAPDGTIWKIATSAKKDAGPATRDVDEVVLLLGVDDVKATKQFYAGKGMAVGKSFGGKYAEFDTPGSTVKLALYPRKAAAKDAGVDAAGSGSHRLVVAGELGSFTDPDGYVWESAGVG
jgi:predicted lactoylglutathione lyase